MPFIITDTVYYGYTIDMGKLVTFYPIYFSSDLANAERFVDTILLRIYDSEKRLVRDLFEYFLLPYDKYYKYRHGQKEAHHLIKIADIVKKYGIPIGYYLVLAIYGIRVRGIDPSSGKNVEYYHAVFPDSIEYGGLSDDEIKREVERNKDLIMKFAKEYSYLAMLTNTPLANLAQDLAAALTRFIIGDYEGAVKFYRKNVEGIRNYLQNVNRIDGSKRRAKALLAFSKKAFHLISNFGEHFGTSGGPEEAELARNITLDLLKYIITKIKQKRIELKQT